MPVTFEQYIAQFEELGTYGEYSDRLKEELRDHFDDSVHTGMVLGKTESEAQEKALQNLGESKIIIHEFKKIMKFNNKYALWMESLFLGIISIPVFQFVLFIFSIFTGIYADDIGIPLPFLGYLISYGISFFVLTIFYLFTLKSIFRFFEAKIKTVVFSLGLFIPPFLFAVVFTDSFISNVSFIEYLLSVFVPALIAFSFIIFFFTKKKEELFKKTQEKKQWQKIFSWIPFMIAILFIPVIFLTNGGFVGMDSSVNLSFIDFVSFLRAIFESVNVPIINFHYTGALVGNEGIYLFGIIYIFLAIVCIYKITIFFADKTRIKNIPNFPWFSLILFVYIFSLFFLVKLPAWATQSKITWHVPVKNISQTMQKNLLGFLYNPVIYLVNNSPISERLFFFYELTGNENSFTIGNPDNEGNIRIYYLAFPNVDDSFQDRIIDITGKPQAPLLGLELSKAKESEIGDNGFFAGAKDFPKDVVCKQNINKTIRYSSDPDDTTYCHELYYQDKLIYTQDHATVLYQFEIMKQYPQYALLKFHNPEAGNQEVYLIQVTE